MRNDRDYEDWLHRYDEPSQSHPRVTCADRDCGIEIFTGGVSLGGKTYCWAHGHERLSPTMSQPEKKRSA